MRGKKDCSDLRLANGRWRRFCTEAEVTTIIFPDPMTQWPWPLKPVSRYLFSFSAASICGMMVDQQDSPLWYALILRCQDMPGIIASASTFHAYEAKSQACPPYPLHPRHLNVCHLRVRVDVRSGSKSTSCSLAPISTGVPRLSQ